MKVKVKFTGLKYDTLKKVSFTKIYESDTDFTDQETEFHGHTLIHTAIEQADKWIEGLDKKDLIIDKDLRYILDWEIVLLGEQPLSITTAIENLGHCLTVQFGGATRKCRNG